MVPHGRSPSGSCIGHPRLARRPAKPASGRHLRRTDRRKRPPAGLASSATLAFGQLHRPARVAVEQACPLFFPVPPELWLLPARLFINDRRN